MTSQSIAELDEIERKLGDIQIKFDDAFQIIFKDFDNLQFNAEFAIEKDWLNVVFKYIKSLGRCLFKAKNLLSQLNKYLKRAKIQLKIKECTLKISGVKERIEKRTN
ncbi:hypothetical protein EDEG_03684 [Edhazardia aedis USNM 41457]|uniref:Uncharacterized protein n=1 Tax=Edhazardia aedis (strain USNM 41457) TaxID=1003232 RepID=J8ZQ66_EDHAE|nr:hypothetical protein EDEG_03684 [Edhazardia aedis USNM 41457]|eukprot:EJW01838.1 hypothetical protein EDEG_03684 [Edhazardia aedis USNM 41457]